MTPPQTSAGARGDAEPVVTSAARFFRVIASVYELHAEVAEIVLDEGARRRLTEELRFLQETLREAVVADAYAELIRLEPPPGPDLTQDELRIACSELLGWLLALLPEAEKAAGRARAEQEEAEGAGGEPDGDTGSAAGSGAEEGAGARPHPGGASAGPGRQRRAAENA
ncbi:MAG TPA: proteasome activator [Actinomadura sp.]|jgi:hypothetical protein|nr:proteasome activator [Actinomadura sp.]